MTTKNDLKAIIEMLSAIETLVAETKKYAEDSLSLIDEDDKIDDPNNVAILTSIKKLASIRDKISSVNFKMRALNNLIVRATE